MSFAVDIPDPSREEWYTAAYCETREEAIAYAREHYGADEEGRICLVSDLGPDDDSEEDA